MTEKDWKLVMRILALAVVVALSATMAQAQDDKDVKESYTAFAVNMSNVGAGRASSFQINITRWSTDEERAKLLTTLKEKGHDDFISELRDQEETGFVTGHGPVARANPFPSTRLHYAYQHIENGTRKVVLITNRPIGFSEAANNSRSLDYDTSAITMDLPEKGDAKGKGSMYVALKISVNKDNGHLTVEQSASEPVRLNQISRQN